MDGEIRVSRSIIDEIDFSDKEGDIFKGESCVTGSIIGELH